MPLRFVVAGTGRCGTGWAARVLTLAGVRCGHESVLDHDRQRSLERVPSTTLVGDASLAAGRYVDQLPDVQVLHLVRDPLDCLRSWMGDAFFEDLTSPYAEMMTAEIPELHDEDKLGRAILWIAWWTRTIGLRARGVYRMERLEDLVADAALLGDVIRWLGFHPPDDLADISAGVGVINVHARADLTWEDVDQHHLGHLLRSTADWTGYRQTVTV